MLMPQSIEVSAMGFRQRIIASVVGAFRGSALYPYPDSFPAWESRLSHVAGLPVGLMGALVRNIMPERRAELLSAVSEQLHIVGPARTGNVIDTVVEQVFGPPARYRRGSAHGRRSVPGWNDL